MRTASRTVEGLKPMDDTFFHKLVERKEFCEELLQVILHKRDLKVVEYVPQRSLRNVKGRSVIVDVHCMDRERRHYNVELQKEDNDDHQRRVRYNGSNLDTFISEKGIKFKDLPELYIIYISAFDIFRKGKTVYHVDRTLRETGDVVDNGFHEIYVNTEVDDHTDIADLMKLFQDSSIPEDNRFPEICNSIRYYKEGKGRDDMCAIVEEYAKEYAKDMKTESAKKMIQKGYSAEDIHEILNLSYEEIKELKRETV